MSYLHNYIGSEYIQLYLHFSANNTENIFNFTAEPVSHLVAADGITVIKKEMHFLTKDLRKVIIWHVNIMWVQCRWHLKYQAVGNLLRRQCLSMHKQNGYCNNSNGFIEKGQDQCKEKWIVKKHKLISFSEGSKHVELYSLILFFFYP